MKTYAIAVILAISGLSACSCVPSIDAPDAGRSSAPTGSSGATAPEDAGSPPPFPSTECLASGSCPAELQTLDWWLAVAVRDGLRVYAAHSTDVTRSTIVRRVGDSATFTFPYNAISFVVDWSWDGQSSPVAGDRYVHEHVEPGCYEAEGAGAKSTVAPQCFPGFDGFTVSDGTSYVFVTSHPLAAPARTYRLVGPTISADQTRLGAPVTLDDVAAMLDQHATSKRRR